jgi:hypothetical protein
MDKVAYFALFLALGRSPNFREEGQVMDDRTRRALEGSIRKWEAIVAGTGKDLGASNCPLCAEFYDAVDVDEETGEEINCRGCPVRDRTEHDLCGGSPYERYAPGNREVAREMLDFLKSLRPSTEKENHE